MASVGSTLDALSSRMDMTIKTTYAGCADGQWVIKTARAIALAIQSAANVYQAKKNETADPSIASRIEEISGIVEDFEKECHKDGGDLSSLSKRIRTFIKDLPWLRKEPRLTDYPRVAITHENTVYVGFKGNFPFANRPAYTPTLTFGEETYRPVINHQEHIGFEVSTTHFQNLQKEHSSYTGATLQVLWDNSWFFSCVVTDTYKVWIEALPSCPGKLEVTYVTPHSKRESKEFKSDIFHATSSSCHFTAHLTEGWQMEDEGSIELIEDVLPGQRACQSNYNCTIKNNGNSIDCIITELNPGDILHFHLTGEQYKKHIHYETRIMKISDLKWGEQRQLVAQDNETFRKLKFTTFNGEGIELQDPDSTNPFIKLRIESGGYVVSTEVPGDLVKPMLGLED